MWAYVRPWYNHVIQDKNYQNKVTKTQHIIQEKNYQNKLTKAQNNTQYFTV